MNVSPPSPENPRTTPGRKPRKAAKPILAGLAALLIIGLIAVVPRLLEEVSHGPPAIGGPFTLIDQTGHTVTSGNFHGKLMLIYFGYTYCPDACPTTLANVAQAYDKLAPAEQAKVVPIFITVDPERDTVDQMASYVGNFSPALVGLTGTPDQLKPVLQEFRVYASKVDGSDGNYSVDHSSILYLMDRNGKFVTHFDSTATPQQIADGVKKQLAAG
jgi:cytochrome oxidase Cu insertion factor (SCO1/SenC/PrrC family)